MGDIQISFTTGKLRTCLPTLKSSLEKNLKSHVVFKVTSNPFSSIYVGQTSQHVTARISEPVGQQLVECCGSAHNIEWEILDVYREVEKPMTIEGIYQKAETRIKYARRVPGRELTLKY